MHLLLDIAEASATFLGDRTRVLWWLYRTPDAIGMRRVTDPMVATWDDCPIEDAGLSGFVILAESHLSIHTYPHRGLAYVDLFSCRSFDIEAAAAAVQEAFGGQVEVRAAVLRGPENVSSDTFSPGAAL